MNDENAKKIDEYIAQNPDCKLPKTHSVIIKGENHLITSSYLGIVEPFKGVDHRVYIHASHIIVVKL